MVRKRLSVMGNYQFCAQWVSSQKMEDCPTVLDYGCGAGEIVEELLLRRVNAFGCDVFYGGADRLSSVRTTLLENDVVRRMEGSVIPFGDDSFDFVINNQVMEHVEDLDTVLAEIHRVLKPGGTVLSLFPSKEVWHEGHCGIPFLHRFPRGRFRLCFTAALRLLGFGYHKDKHEGVIHWSRRQCEYLDRWTCYRTQRDIDSAYSRYFSDIQHIEDCWLQVRTGRRLTNCGLLAPTQRLIVTRLCGLVFTTRKVDDRLA